MMRTMDVNALTGEIVDAAFNLHRRLGPGLLESVYESVLARDLERRQLRVQRQKPLAFEYEGMQFTQGLIVDLLVEETVVVELKSLERLAPIHAKQVLTYLRLLKLPVGLLINFGAPTFKAGVQRIVNNYAPPTDSQASGAS
jgi:iron complex transport system substrate-binding protein